MTCASVTIRLRGLMYINLANQSVTYVSGTFVTLDSGLNTRVKKGSTRETNRSSKLRTRGRRTATVPTLNVNRRGLPCPLRSPVCASPGILRSGFRRPKTSVTSCSNRSWSQTCRCCRA
jgi:hypothetical protein